MSQNGASAPPRAPGRPRPVQCKVCTIYIGEGYQETQPIPLPEAKGYVCWQCSESLRRQLERRSAPDARPERPRR
jgi:hypothetical protein